MALRRKRGGKRWRSGCQACSAGQLVVTRHRIVDMDNDQRPLPAARLGEVHQKLDWCRFPAPDCLRVPHWPESTCLAIRPASRGLARVQAKRPDTLLNLHAAIARSKVDQFDSICARGLEAKVGRLQDGDLQIGRVRGVRQLWPAPGAAL